MHKSATKCNETIGKWCKNKHGASKIIDTFETYQVLKLSIFVGLGGKSSGAKRMSMKGSEWDFIHSYVLNSMEEVKPYIK
jgi:hypothetical protein